MNHVSIPKDPDSSVQLRPLVCFNEGMRSPYDLVAEIERFDCIIDGGPWKVIGGVLGACVKHDKKDCVRCAADHLASL